MYEEGEENAFEKNEEVGVVARKGLYEEKLKIHLEVIYKKRDKVYK